MTHYASGYEAKPAGALVRVAMHRYAPSSFVALPMLYLLAHTGPMPAAMLLGLRNTLPHMPHLLLRVSEACPSNGSSGCT